MEKIGTLCANLFIITAMVPSRKYGYINEEVCFTNNKIRILRSLSKVL